MGRIGCTREKSRCDFVARTFALIAPVDPVLHRVSGSYETIPNAAKHYATHQNMSIGSNGVDSVCSLQKIPTWLRGTKFCINSPVHTVLYRVSCSYETIPNAPKHYATHQNMTLGSNGADWVRSLRKIAMWLHVTNFCINCTGDPVLHRVSCSYETIPNAAKHYAMHQNMTLGSNGADWVRSLW